MQQILYVTPYVPYPLNKAANLFIFKRIKILSSAYEISLLSVTNNRTAADADYSELGKYLKALKIVLRKRVDPFTAISAALSRESLFNLLAREILREISEQHQSCDVVIFEHSFIAGFVLEKLPELREKSIVVFHNLEGPYFDKLFRLTAFPNIRKLFYWLEKRGAYRHEELLREYPLRACFFLSSKDLESFRTDANADRLLLSPTIDFSPVTAKRDQAQKDFDLVYVGQLDNGRNLEGLAWFFSRVWPAVQCERPGTSMAIAGRGDRQGVEKLVGAGHNIHLIGPVEDLSGLFSRSRICIVPMLATIGVQTKLFEALSHGILTVATSAAVEGTLFQHDRHLLVAGSEQEFSRQILAGLENPEKFSRFRDELESLAEFFREDRMLAEMQRLIEGDVMREQQIP
jgi:hypothetical protein